MHMNVTQMVAYDFAAFMLKPVVDPTQMRSFDDKPASAKVTCRPTAKSGNDDPAVIGDATEPLATI